MDYVHSLFFVFFFWRLKHVGYHIARYPINIARYKMLSHRKEKANPKRYDPVIHWQWEMDLLNSSLKIIFIPIFFSQNFRYEQLVSGVKKFESDGLNSLKYEVRAFERKVLYTWILVEIKKESVCLIHWLKSLHWFEWFILNNLIIFFLSFFMPTIWWWQPFPLWNQRQCLPSFFFSVDECIS